MELREIYDFNQKCIQEAKKEDKKTVRFVSPFMVADGVNKNKRQYPFQILSNAIEEYNTKIQAGKGVGGAYHPKTGHLEIPDVSHTITKMFMKGKTAYVEGRILSDNEKGKKILSLIKAGSVLGLSARGFGNMEQKDGISIIQPDYRMAGVDFVLNPSEDVAKVDQSSIFESAPVEEEKFDVSLVEFNFIVEKFLEEKFGDKPREGYLEFCDKNWQGIADDIEADMVKAGKIIESIEKTEIKMEDFPIAEEHFEMAKLSGYRGTLNDFMELKSKQDDPLFKEFREAQLSGYEKNFETFKKESLKK